MTRLRLSGCVVDLEIGEVRGEGRTTTLSGSERALLCFLASHPEQTLSREQILVAVFDDTDQGLLKGQDVEAMEGGSDFVCGLIRLGYDHGCADGEDGLVCWGSDGNGQAAP